MNKETRSNESEKEDENPSMLHDFYVWFAGERERERERNPWEENLYRESSYLLVCSSLGRTLS